MNPDLFDQTADELWDLKLSAIVSIKAIDDKERGALEATILRKYGKAVSLKGTTDQVRDALIAAKK
ncbi:hypothetical protein FBZ96_106610 [Bradyrhizobium stylosanthis]|uniref:Uncharacterized protein n=2 Tax=Bradyrhizobium stylosanthis TaxID=1803665 RepID=A0A560DKB3_9BRAD|nr:hypothetical protein FBZ96_106610 [Bradyrhizobium stylosanthis]